MGQLLDFQILYPQLTRVKYHTINLSDIRLSTLSLCSVLSGILSHAFLQLEYLGKGLSPTSSLAFSASLNAFLDLDLAVMAA
jgi:hypothetical protein